MKIGFVYMNNVRNIGRGAGYAFASIPPHHETWFYDTAVTSPNELLRKLPDHDVLMFSVSTLFMPMALRIAKSVRRDSGVPILWGGIHPTIEGMHLHQQYPFEVPYVWVGECERDLAEWLNLFDRGDAPVVYEGGLADLDSLPPFPWVLFANRVVNEKGWIYVNATRGCPSKCAYCCNATYLNRYGSEYLRNRPVQGVIEELDYLNIFHEPEMFYFGDEMMFFDREYAKELIGRVHKEIGMPMGAMIRPEALDSDLVGFLKANGFRYLAMGVECGEESYRNEVLRRHGSNKRIAESFRMAKDAGIETCSFNMVGFPSEHDEKLTQATAALNRKIEPDIMQTTWFYPFPGTPLGDRCREDGIVLPTEQTTYHAGSALTMHRDKPALASDYINKYMTD